MIIPVHNGERYVAQAVQSVISQDGVDLQVIVADDASTDNTGQIIEGFGDAVTYVRLPKQPTGIAATNQGLAEATGELICVVHHDDFLLPGKLRRHVDLMQEHPTLGFSYSAQHFVGPDGEHLATLHSPVRRSDYVVPGRRELECLAVQNYINFCNAVVRRSALEEVGGFPPEWQIVAEWLTWIRLAKRHDVGYLNEPLVAYRVHPGQMTLKRRPEDFLRQLLLVHNETFDDADPGLSPRTKRLARDNIDLTVAFALFLRRERAAALRHAARAMRLWPWEALTFYRRSTLGVRARLALAWRRSRT